MKIALPVFGLIAVLGLAYGLAFLGIIPAQKMADHSPGLGKTLIALHLAKPKKPAATKTAASAPATVSPEQDALNAEKKQIADSKAALAKAQADFEAEQQAAKTAPASPAAQIAAPPQTAAKLDAIYAAMSPDDLVTLFARLPDPAVLRALVNLDDKKAGKVLAGLPPARAARLTEALSRPRPTALASL